MILPAVILWQLVMAIFCQLNQLGPSDNPEGDEEVIPNMNPEQINVTSSRPRQRNISWRSPIIKGSARRTVSTNSTQTNTNSPSVVSTPSSILTNNEKRGLLRHVLHEGEELKRPLKNKKDRPLPSPLSTKELEAFHRRIDRAIRWNTMLVHININLDEVVLSITGDRVAEESRDFRDLIFRTSQNIRQWKSTVCHFALVSCTQGCVNRGVGL